MKIKNSGAADAQSKTAYLAYHFACTCCIPIILGASRNKLGDDVSIQLVRHVPEKIPGGNAGLTRTPLVHHTVRIVIEDLLLEGVQGLVKLQSSMAGGESRHKDVGLGAFDRIVLDTSVNGLQDVVGAEAEGANVEGGIGNESEQMGGALNSDGGGFVDSLAEFALETVQHQFGRGFTTGVFGDTANV